MPVPVYTIPDMTKPKAKPRVLIPEGDYEAILSRVLWLGTFWQEPMKQKNGEMSKRKEVQKIRLGFEVNCKADGAEKNAIIYTRSFTVSFHENSNLGQFLKGWLGRSLPKPGQTVSFSSLLERPAWLGIDIASFKKDGVQDPILYEQIASIAPFSGGRATFTPEHDSFEWAINDPGAIDDPRVKMNHKEEACRSEEAKAIGIVMPALGQSSIEKQVIERFDATRVSGHAVNAHSGGDEIPF